MPPVKKIHLDVLKTLYYKEKLSGVDVAEHFGVNVSAVYKSMQRHGLPRRLSQETNKLRFTRTPESFSFKAKLSLEEEKLKIAGVMLYAAEGAKANPKRRGYIVDFANSNPRLVKIFITFLREICCVDEQRLRGYLFYYPNQDSEELRKFWSKVVGIPLSQFTKPYMRKYYSKDKEGVLPYGVLHVRYSDKRLLEEVERLAREYADNL